jgi:triacylglycerol lipase
MPALPTAIALARRPIWRENVFWLELATLLRDPSFRKPHRAAVTSSVLLIPGFMTGDRHLAIMKRWLEQAGHDTACAGIRLNIDCSAAAVARLERKLEELVSAQERRVVLIGQSRGGLFARVLAVRRPDLVESIVTLGSPHIAPTHLHPALWLQGASLAIAGTLGVPGLFRHSCRAGECCAEFRRDLAARFPRDVDFFSVYSRKDGLVDWRACLDVAAEPIEIDSTHCGMGVNPGTYRFLDERLNLGAAGRELRRSAQSAVGTQTAA